MGSRRRSDVLPLNHTPDVDTASGSDEIRSAPPILAHPVRVTKRKHEADSPPPSARRRLAFDLIEPDADVLALHNIPMPNWSQLAGGTYVTTFIYQGMRIAVEQKRDGFYVGLKHVCDLQNRNEEKMDPARALCRHLGLDHPNPTPSAMWRIYSDSATYRPDLVKLPGRPYQHVDCNTRTEDPVVAREFLLSANAVYALVKRTGSSDAVSDGMRIRMRKLLTVRFLCGAADLAHAGIGL